MSGSEQDTHTAYHEAGHAVIALMLGRSVHEVSILPGGKRLGYCEMRKGGRAPKDALEADLLILLAGMADAAFGERAIIHRSLDMRGEEKHFDLGRPVRSTTAWLAGSRDIGEADAARWRTAMAELVADGTQKRIFRQYGLA